MFSFGKLQIFGITFSHNPFRTVRKYASVAQQQQQKNSISKHINQVKITQAFIITQRAVQPAANISHAIRKSPPRTADPNGANQAWRRQRRLQRFAVPV